jgi:hypothetical protein
VKIMTRNTVDERLADMQSEKNKIIAAALKEDDVNKATPTIEDLKRLIGTNHEDSEDEEEEAERRNNRRARQKQSRGNIPEHTEAAEDRPGDIAEESGISVGRGTLGPRIFEEIALQDTSSGGQEMEEDDASSLLGYPGGEPWGQVAEDDDEEDYTDDLPTQ